MGWRDAYLDDERLRSGDAAHQSVQAARAGGDPPAPGRNLPCRPDHRGGPLPGLRRSIPELASSRPQGHPMRSTINSSRDRRCAGHARDAHTARCNRGRSNRHVTRRVPRVRPARSGNLRQTAQAAVEAGVNDYVTPGYDESTSHYPPRAAQGFPWGTKEYEEELNKR